MSRIKTSTARCSSSALQQSGVGCEILFWNNVVSVPTSQKMALDGVALFTLASFCSASELITLNLVNKSWNQIIDSDEIWNRVYAIDFPSDDLIEPSTKKRKTENSSNNFECQVKYQYACAKASRHLQLVSKENIYKRLKKLFHDEDEEFAFKKEQDLTLEMQQMMAGVEGVDDIESIGHYVRQFSDEGEHICKCVLKNGLSGEIYTIYYSFEGNPFGSVHVGDNVEPLCKIWDAIWEKEDDELVKSINEQFFKIVDSDDNEQVGEENEEDDEEDEE